MQNATPVKFYAHKATLAAHSPVFARMFEYYMKEGSTNEVTMSGIEPTVLKLHVVILVCRLLSVYMKITTSQP